LRLASLNVHCGLDHRARRYPVKNAIAALGADVVVVQENWRPDGQQSLAARAAADCGYPAYAEVDLVSGPLAGMDISSAEVPDEEGAWGLAMMSRVPWPTMNTVALGAAPGDVVGDRYAQVAEIPLGAGSLRIVNVHLTHRILHGPAQLRRLLAGLGDPVNPAVIAGDLNMCRPTVYLARPYRPAARGRTFPAHRPLAQLDHILAGPGVTVTDVRTGPPVGSDHLPVQVTLGLAS
jgi:endonuclease/exonuclease/phosphatase family metal-dependent hydrolase